MKDAFFVNLSNHHSTKWNKGQLDAANLLGDIVDIPFPVVDEEADESQIQTLVHEYLQKIHLETEGCSQAKVTIHIMGEMTFTYAMVKALQNEGYTCVASTTKRIVEEHGDGTKTVKFEFCRFRRYE